LNEILSVNCKFIRDSIPILSDKLKLEYLKYGLISAKKDKAINET